MHTCIALNLRLMLPFHKAGRHVGTLSQYLCAHFRPGDVLFAYITHLQVSCVAERAVQSFAVQPSLLRRVREPNLDFGGR